MLKNDLLPQFFDSLIDYGIVLLDRQGHVIDLNIGATRMKGYEPSEVVGRHFSMFYTAEANAVGHPERELSIALSIGRYEEEGWRVCKDGRRFWAHVTIVPLHDATMNVRGFGKIVRDFTARKQEVEQLANVMKLLELSARTDHLTGLDNRRSFEMALAVAVSRARRYERPLGLAMLDIDLFKRFNDDFGHPAGDAYLRTAASCWRATMRPTDFIGRYGGEEFVVLLHETDLAGAVAAAARLQVATPPPLTCSIGLAILAGMETEEQLIARADLALYLAKRAGRNRTAVAATPERPD